MNNVKVSVIMPVYNAQIYLQDTLKDVIHQSLEEIEIICIDDGSTDESVKTITEMQANDSRIKLISQKNLYAGVARNQGLKKAVGEYVVFWDSDDRFAYNALEIMYKRSKQEDADICVCSAQRYDQKTDSLISTNVYLNKSMLGNKDIINKNILPKYLFNFATNVPWNKMYRRSFIEDNGLEFQDLKQANDTYFTLMAFFLAERITYVENSLITYRVNNKDSLSGKASGTVFCAYESYLYTYEKMREYKEFAMVEQSFFNRVVDGFMHSLNLQTDYDMFCLLYDKYRQEGFQNFRLDQFEKSYFYKSWYYTDLNFILKHEAPEFLLYKSIERKRKVDELRSECTKYKKAYKSKSYKVGLIATAIPRKVKKIWRFKK
ncbi:Chondroitin polymerase [uncultured Roseburia sp.]|uniref:Glycosyltransferase n=1 Tax=Brotonthovivens ammoniilytica TaxID=2981725 RepID=A0ABT2TKD5_9FIRM|nr:glycosyltransferase family 2 protein [Brotonthovivens ammoniilytica]MCU6762673.1 glycosyltransferase [Brotonthovivens ammoniilytica]SCI84269.1 Chondroitin polymerase [uncultured Roseburia sp.]